MTSPPESAAPPVAPEQPGGAPTAAPEQPRGAPAPPPAGPSPAEPSTAAALAEPPPRLAEGVELVGEFEDSGFKEAPYIARRADGQVIQMPHMLYLVAEQVDGRREFEEIAERVTEASGRGLGAKEVHFLADKKLRPLGVLAQADGSSPKVEKVDPLLALKYRAGVVPERLTWALTTVFKPLFFGPLVALVAAGLIALDVWLFFIHGIAQPTRELLYNPAFIVLIFGAVVVATAFHEIGHATACRYGGATPGKMGVGLYVIWPAFYTDVTDAYRLSRSGRLRTDLGGIYFNAIFALATAAVYAATGLEVLLLIAMVQNFAMIQQLMPFLRLDGYYVISDLTGVPDMFARIRPVLRSLLPGREADDRVEELKPRARRIVIAYVALLVPATIALLVIMALHAPRAFATAYDSLGVQWDKVSAAFDRGETLIGVGSGLQLIALVVPAVGITLTGGRIGSRISRGAWGWSAGSAPRRTGLLVATTAAVALVAYTWWPNGEYRPIQPDERGTLAGAMHNLRSVPGGRPALTPERQEQLGGAPSERDRLAQPGEDPSGRDSGKDASGSDSGESDGKGAAPSGREDDPARAERLRERRRERQQEEQGSGSTTSPSDQPTDDSSSGSTPEEQQPTDQGTQTDPDLGAPPEETTTTEPVPDATSEPTATTP